MRHAWRLWLWTTALLMLYVTAGYIESHFVEIPIKLEAGSVGRARIVRLADDPLLMHLVFPETNRTWPDLGSPEVAKPWPLSKEKRYLRPGSMIRLSATAGSQTVLYEAEPPTAIGTHGRTLTSNLSIERGVWRWPPPLDLPNIVLHPGVTELTIEIISVEAPMAGQSARLLIFPPLISIKGSKKDIGWVGFLGFGPLLSPIMLITQLVWAVVIWVRSRLQTRVSSA